MRHGAPEIGEAGPAGGRRASALPRGGSRTPRDTPSSPQIGPRRRTPSKLRSAPARFPFHRNPHRSSGRHSSGLDAVDRSWDAFAERVTGRPASDAVGSPLSAVLEGVELEPLLDPAVGGQPKAVELAVAHREGDDILVALYANPILDLGGAILETVVVLEDV